jgi:hypothetical protein
LPPSNRFFVIVGWALPTIAAQSKKNRWAVPTLRFQAENGLEAIIFLSQPVSKTGTCKKLMKRVEEAGRAFTRPALCPFKLRTSILTI